MTRRGGARRQQDGQRAALARRLAAHRTRPAGRRPPWRGGARSSPRLADPAWRARRAWRPWVRAACWPMRCSFDSGPRPCLPAGAGAAQPAGRGPRTRGARQGRRHRRTRRRRHRPAASPGTPSALPARWLILLVVAVPDRQQPGGQPHLLPAAADHQLLPAGAEGLLDQRLYLLSSPRCWCWSGAWWSRWPGWRRGRPAGRSASSPPSMPTSSAACRRSSTSI